jgi:hypothetical protein
MVASPAKTGLTMCVAATLFVLLVGAGAVWALCFIAQQEDRRTEELYQEITNKD